MWAGFLELVAGLRCEGGQTQPEQTLTASWCTKSPRKNASWIGERGEHVRGRAPYYPGFKIWRGLESGSDNREGFDWGYKR